jgi:hypothetical protein
MPGAVRLARLRRTVETRRVKKASNRAPRSLDRLLTAAEKQLWIEFEKSNAFTHRGVKGAAREGSIASFLQAHLPERFAVTTGQAIDSQDRESTQLDLIVYDRNLSAPLLRGTDRGDLVPAEALLAVIEAKSRLTKTEAEACCSAVASLALLRPYGRPFVPPRAGGKRANGHDVRCQYSVLAFDTDLGSKNWGANEWARLRAAAMSKGAPVDRIDRVAVLTRGLVLPPDCEAILINEAQGVLRDWFLHLTNFLVRESGRRAPYDWSAYLPDRPESSRLELEGHSGPRRSRRTITDQAKRKRPRSAATSKPTPSSGGRPPRRQARSEGKPDKS